MLSVYLSQGYLRVGQNVRVGPLEIDLIVERGDVVVFCEVRSRASLEWGHPAETVNAQKRSRVRLAAARWLAGQDASNGACRFDVAAVIGAGAASRIVIYEGAF